MDFDQTVREMSAEVKKTVRKHESQWMDIKAFMVKTDSTLESLREKMEELDGRFDDVKERLDEIFSHVSCVMDTNSSSHRDFSEDLSVIKNSLIDMKWELGKIEGTYEHQKMVDEKNGKKLPGKTWAEIVAKSKERISDEKAALMKTSRF